LLGNSSKESSAIFRRIRTCTAMLVTLALAACHEEPTTSSLKVGVSDWAGNDILYIAEGAEYFAQDRVHLVHIPKSANLLQALRDGSLDSAVMPLSQAISWNEMGLNLTMVLALSSSDGAHAVAFKPEITSLAELRNLSIAAERNSEAEFLLKRMMGEQGLSVGDINFIETQVHKATASLFSGAVDAAVLKGADIEIARERGYNILFTSADISEEMLDVLVIKSDLLVENEEQIRELVVAWRTAREKYGDDYKGAILPSGIKSIEQLQASLNTVKLATLSENLSLMAQDGRAFDEFMFAREKSLTGQTVTRKDISLPKVDSRFIFFTQVPGAN